MNDLSLNACQNYQGLTLPSHLNLAINKINLNLSLYDYGSAYRNAICHFGGAFSFTSRLFLTHVI